MTTAYQRMFNRSAEDHTSDFQKALDAHQAKADQIRENAQAALDRIGSRKDLTPEAQRAAAARIYKPATEQIQQMLDQHIAKVTQHKQQLAQKAFGSDRSTDPQTAMARRQARQIAATAEDAYQAEQMVRDAQFDGDDHLARAAAAVAYERGWHDVVDVWNADGRNDTAMRYLIELEQLPDTNDTAWRISTAASYSQPLSGVLDGLKPHEISRAAEEGPEVA
ncbi:hypothetical protein ACFZBE_21530 [Streptomyces sp. NPDC008061]|uniref:hypothetical protein n=1 Tax=Streptomyces sp. NPDC008061 TaxID=3364805 RepID=UPI0036EF270B